MTQKETVLNVLNDRPISNREICEKTGLKTKTVGSILVALVREDLADVFSCNKNPDGPGVRYFYIKKS